MVHARDREEAETSGENPLTAENTTDPGAPDTIVPNLVSGPLQ